jgi:hypothetical protein
MACSDAKLFSTPPLSTDDHDLFFRQVHKINPKLNCGIPVTCYLHNYYKRIFFSSLYSSLSTVAVLKPVTFKSVRQLIIYCFLDYLKTLFICLFFSFKWTSCHHCTSRIRIAANILNKQLRTTDKGQSSSVVIVTNKEADPGGCRSKA